MLICNSVLVHQSSEFGDFVQIVLKSKLSALVASKKSLKRCSPIPDLHCVYNRERKSSSLVYFKPKFGMPNVSPHQRTNSQFFQTNDTPEHSRFYAQCRPGLKILWKLSTQFLFFIHQISFAGVLYKATHYTLL